MNITPSEHAEFYKLAKENYEEAKKRFAEVRAKFEADKVNEQVFNDAYEELLAEVATFKAEEAAYIAIANATKTP